MFYYNQKFEEAEKSKMDWESWKKRINSKGLVDKMEKSVNEVLSEKYITKHIIYKVRDSVSPHEQSINNELTYHISLCFFSIVTI